MIMRPKQFYFVAAAMFAVALSFPVQVMFLYGHHWSETSAIFSKITSINWLVIGSLIFGAYLYFHASRYILYVAPIILALVAFNNYLVGAFAGDFSLIQTSMGTAGIGALFFPLALPSSRVVLKDPKRRWWRRSKRINKRLAATVNPYVGGMVHGHTFDVSKSGAFVCLEDDNNELPKIGDTVRISFNVNSMKKIRCEAVVVRIAEPQGRYPKGMGIRFTSTDKSFDKSFEKVLQSVELNH